MPEPLSRLYDLALRTLDDQERRADALRGRLGPVLAAAALGVTLLSGPVVGGVHPATAAGKLSLLIAVGGLFASLLAAAALLRAGDHRSTDTDVHALALDLTRDGALDDVSVFYARMISRLSREIVIGDDRLTRLHTRFTEMLCGILAMLCGLALAALVG